MQREKNVIATAIIFSILFAFVTIASADENGLGEKHKPKEKKYNVQLGPRPYYLIEDMEESKLKTTLQQCVKGPLYRKPELSLEEKPT